MNDELRPLDILKLPIALHGQHLKTALVNAWEQDRTENRWLWRIVVITSLLAIIFTIPSFSCILQYIQL